MNIKGYIIDLDGVVWKGRTPIPGADKAIAKIRENGKKVLFLTNNATRSREQVATMLTLRNIPCEKEEVMSSAYATALYIKEKYGKSKVYPIGEDGLLYELVKMGHDIVTQGADFVVVGLDRYFTYRKLANALRNIKSGAKFIATNEDPTYKIEADLLPGGGAVVKALEHASEAKPFVIGKPHETILGMSIKVLGLKPSECAIIGDRLDMDIETGKKAGMKTIFVLSGSMTKGDLKKYKVKPDLILDSIKDLL